MLSYKTMEDLDMWARELFILKKWRFGVWGYVQFTINGSWHFFGEWWVGRYFVGIESCEEITKLRWGVVYTV